MGKSITEHRQKKMQAQSGLCYYCSYPMWSEDIKSFSKQYGLTLKQAAKLQCTAEHLTARSEGGNNTLKNIVAACRHCNHTRHVSNQPLSPKQYLNKIKKRLSKRKWHQFHFTVTTKQKS